MMKQRCLNPKSQSYDSYGGRGILICDEWMDYKPFHRWALSNGYKKGLTIERINNDAGYSPDNCTWIPQAEQSYNKTNSAFLEYNGISKTFGEWQNIFGINRRTIQSRIELGWSAHEALTIIPGGNRKGV